MPRPRLYFAGIVAAVLAAAGAWLLLVDGQKGRQTPGHFWVYALNQAKLEAARAKRSPKLILAGGSSVWFGARARQVEQETGVAAVNLGTHAGLALDYMLQMPKRVARRGDAVVLVLEYAGYSGEIGDLLVDYVYAYDPAFLAEMPRRERPVFPFRMSLERLVTGYLAPAVQPRPARPPRAEEIACYSPFAADEFGDQVCNQGPYEERWRRPDEVRRLARATPESPAAIPASSFDSLRGFFAWARRDGVGVVASYPSAVRSARYANPQWRAYFERLEAFLRAEEVPVAGAPGDFLFDEGLFLDTEYHVTGEGARLRTSRLIERLRECGFRWPAAR